MPQPIEHRAHFDAPADEVHGVLLDADHLAARLKEMGGKDAALVEHDVDGSPARIALRQGIPVEFLPSVVRRFTGEDLVLDRVERWRPRDAGGWTADVEVTVRGLPGSISGTQELTDTDTGGSELVLRGTTRVPVPMVGGRIEAVVAEQVGVLLGHETRFTQRWLADHR